MSEMMATVEQISSLLQEAGEIHHRVFRIVDGADGDWASWYADWLVNLSELPALLGAKPVRSELVYLLVSLDKEYTAARQEEPWETYYARRLLSHFSPGKLSVAASRRGHASRPLLMSSASASTQSRSARNIARAYSASITNRRAWSPARWLSPASSASS